MWHLYLEAGPQTVGVVSAVAAVTQQHVVGVSFTSADPAASVEDGAGPEDTSLQAGQVHKDLSRGKSVSMLRDRRRVCPQPIRAELQGGLT